MTENERLEVIEQRLIVLRQAMVDTAYDNSEQPGTYTADVSWLLSFADELQAMVVSDQAEIAKLRAALREIAAGVPHPDWNAEDALK